MAQIHEAINRVMQEMGAVGKNSSNNQQGYKYRGIDAVMNALHPAMTKNGIFTAPHVLEYSREERQNAKGTNLIYSVANVQYDFFATDGSCVCVTVVGEGMDTGDKSMNKAMSAAFKYACFQLFCIPTEEMKDSEEETHEVVRRAESPSKPTEAYRQENVQQQAQNAAAAATEAQRNAIRSICQKQGWDLAGVYKLANTTEETCTKDLAAKIMRWLNEKVNHGRQG